MTLDLSTYLVTDTRLCGDRGVPDTVRAAAAGGVTAVQLREKDASARSLYLLARALLDALEGTGVPLLVNDRLDVALASGAHGVHLGQDDLPVDEARRLGGRDFWVGLSVSNTEQLDAANALPAGQVDYLGLSPAFTTATKPDAEQELGIDGLTRLGRRTDLPCVAIGGIHVGNVATVRASGVDGIAVVSAICAAADPAAAAAELGGARR